MYWTQASSVFASNELDVVCVDTRSFCWRHDTRTLSYLLARRKDSMKKLLCAEHTWNFLDSPFHCLKSVHFATRKSFSRFSKLILLTEKEAVEQSSKQRQWRLMMDDKYQTLKIMAYERMRRKRRIGSSSLIIHTQTLDTAQLQQCTEAVFMLQTQCTK